jgi:hypothetical protein
LVARAVGVGRLVFRALVVAEFVLAVALTTALLLDPVVGVGAIVLVGPLWVVLAAQATVAAPAPRSPRPRHRDRRQRVTLAAAPGPSRVRRGQGRGAACLGVVLVSGIAS